MTYEIVKLFRSFGLPDSEFAGDKNGPGATVEHAGIEVDASVPAVETEAPLVVSQILVSLVVLFGDISPVLLSKELVSLLCHLFKQVVCIVASGH